MSIPWAKIIPLVQTYAPVVWRWWQRRKQAKAAKALMDGYRDEEGW